MLGVESLGVKFKKVPIFCDFSIFRRTISFSLIDGSKKIIITLVIERIEIRIKCIKIEFFFVVCWKMKKMIVK